MVYLMEAPDEVTRWEARSHERIHADVWTEEPARLLPLAETLSIWRRIGADLGEIRSLYEAAHRRVLDVSAGADADAGHVAAGVVTRALAEAQELAGSAGARRASLSELHGQLRVAMPIPRPPVEESSGFLRGGRAWLNAPDFHGDDAARRNDEEYARDLMRRYEQDIAVEQLGRPAVCDASHGTTVPDRANDCERTVPLSAGPAGVPAAAVPAPLRPVPGHGWSDADFGPVGDVSGAAADTYADIPADGDTATHDAQDARGAQAMAGGAGRPPDSYLEDVAGPIRSTTANPFEVDIRLVPPVLGE